MSKKMLLYVFIIFISILVVLFATFFKPVSIFFIESYASNILEQKVRVSSFDLSKFSIQATIQEPKNIINAKLITLSPLNIQASFKGDIDAFKKYHKLIGNASIKANIIYDKKLSVDAKAKLYNGNIFVNIKELDDTYLVTSNAESLNISEFKKQNSLNIDFDGVVDFKFSKKNKDFTLDATMFSQKFQTLKLDAKGELNETNISASCSIALKDKNLKLQNIIFDTTTYKTSISSKDFGGDLNLVFKDSKVFLDAKALHLQKILSFIKYKDHLSGFVDIKGEFDAKSKNAYLFLKSPKIKALEQELKDIYLKVDSLHFKDNKLSFIYTLDATYLKKTFNFDGKLSYKDKLYLEANSSNFNSKTNFKIDDKEIKLSVKKLDIKELLNFLELKSSVLGVVNLDARGSFEKFIFKLDSDISLNKLDAKIQADGFFATKTKELNSKFTLLTKLGNENIKLNGDANFKKEFKLNATSSSFGANTKLRLKAKGFEFYTKDLDMQRVAKAFEKPKLPFGKIDFLASGDFQNIALKIRSKELRRDMSIQNINNYISFDLSGSYKDNILRIKDKINLHYKTKKLPLQLNANISLVAPFSSNGSLAHKDDEIIVESFSFKDEQIKSNFEVDIKDLYLYRAAFSRPLYGELKIIANFNNMLNIKSKSFGGELNIGLDKANVIVDINKLDAKKTAYLFNKSTSVNSGSIDGTINYDIMQKKAKTDIHLRDVTIDGVDIDKKIRDVDDLLGLNVVSVTKSIISNYYDDKKQQTYIPQMLLNISLKDKEIKLNDTALSTKEFLIVAQGKLQDSGEIKNLDVSIVDKNGCAIVTQALSGNIKQPKIAKTSSTLVNIVQSVPDSVLKTAGKLVDFGASSVDEIASFGIKQIFRSDTNVSITSDIISKSRSIVKFGSDMIMPSGCKVIYSGKVTHPANLKKGEKR